MDRAVDALNLGTAAGGDLSLWGLFVQADIVVKIVMIGLLFASVWVWAVVFEKWSTIRKANKDADAFEDRFWSGGSLEDLYDQEGARPTHPMAAVFGAAMGEWRRTARVAGADITHTSVRERVDRAIGVTVGARWTGWNAGWCSWPRSGPRPRSSACSARCGASCTASRPSRPCTTPTSLWSRRASRRHCSRPPSGSWRRSRPCSPTIRSVPTCHASPPGWRRSAPNSAPFCRARPRRRRDGGYAPEGRNERPPSRWGKGARGRAASPEPPYSRPQVRRHCRTDPFP